MPRKLKTDALERHLRYWHDYYKKKMSLKLWVYSSSWEENQGWEWETERLSHPCHESRSIESAGTALAGFCQQGTHMCTTTLWNGHPLQVIWGNTDTYTHTQTRGRRLFTWKYNLGRTTSKNKILKGEIN